MMLIFILHFQEMLRKMGFGGLIPIVLIARPLLFFILYYLAYLSKFLVIMFTIRYLSILFVGMCPYTIFSDTFMITLERMSLCWGFRFLSFLVK